MLQCVLQCVLQRVSPFRALCSESISFSVNIVTFVLVTTIMLIGAGDMYIYMYIDCLSECLCASLVHAQILTHFARRHIVRVCVKLHVTHMNESCLT